jgi:uncharacterized protein
MFRPLTVRLMGLAFTILACFSVTAAAQEQTSAYRAELATFRSDRAKDLGAPDGWFSLVGLEWLHQGVNTVGSASDNSLHLPSGAPQHLAVIEQVGNLPGVQLKIAPPQTSGGFPAGFLVDKAKPSTGRLPLTSELTFGSYTVLILSRGDRLGLRIKDANAPTRTAFHRLNWYEPAEAYRVEAKWIPYTTEHVVAIPTIIGTTLHEKVPGIAHFTINGKIVRLEPIVEDNRLFFILRDTTSRTTTYGAARFLYTDFPPAGLTHPGALTLDFNRLVNPPCAYTAFATCPLPPSQNRLVIAIPAGEKRYHE